MAPAKGLEPLSLRSGVARSAVELRRRGKGREIRTLDLVFPTHAPCPGWAIPLRRAPFRGLEPRIVRVTTGRDTDYARRVWIGTRGMDSNLRPSRCRRDALTRLSYSGAGAGGRFRAADLRGFKAALFLLSYSSRWTRPGGSNPVVAVLQAAAFPLGKIGDAGTRGTTRTLVSWFRATCPTG